MELNDLLKKTQGDPKAVYTAGGRTLFFRLETLARIGAGIGDKDDFERARALFKQAEDQIGAYDFYAAYIPLFNENKNCRMAFLAAFGEQLEKRKISLRDHLITWSGKEATETTKAFLQHCENIRYEDEDSFKEAFGKFIIKSLEKIVRDYQEGKYETDDIEAGLHELRRKIRWISLYIQVSQGIVQHQPSQQPDKKFTKYITKETLASPFMKLPVHTSFTQPILLRTETYGALSWMIATLGVYKDEALSMALFAEHPDMENCYKSTKPEKQTVADILDNVKTVSHQFFTIDRIPEEIISDIKSHI